MACFFGSLERSKKTRTRAVTMYITKHLTMPLTARTWSNGITKAREIGGDCPFTSDKAQDEGADWPRLIGARGTRPEVYPYVH